MAKSVEPIPMSGQGQQERVLAALREGMTLGRRITREETFTRRASGAAFDANQADDPGVQAAHALLVAGLYLASDVITGNGHPPNYSGRALLGAHRVDATLSRLRTYMKLGAKGNGEDPAFLNTLALVETCSDYVHGLVTPDPFG